MSRPNILFLMSDEHAREALGCYGHEFVQTPNLDRLAGRGTRFTQAYTPSPVCVPARAALATGRYVHQNRCWSNAEAYDGSIPSWGHRLRGAGYRTLSFGKLHFRSSADDNGFDREILPLHIRDEKGWVRGLLRRHPAPFDCSGFGRDIGPGECDYTHYDRSVCAAACDWLGQESQRVSDSPWACS